MKGKSQSQYKKKSNLPGSGVFVKVYSSWVLFTVTSFSVNIVVSRRTLVKPSILTWVYKNDFLNVLN